MESGKLPKEILLKLLQQIHTSESVIVGPGYGEDAAAVRVSQDILVAASDPITFATEEIGWYAVTVNANDIAAMGARPEFILTTILLPRGSTPEEAQLIFRQILSTCESLGISLIGGHTEITDAVTRTVVSAVMLGTARADQLITTSGAKIGDKVLLVGNYAVEGTALLAREAADDLRASGVDSVTIERAAGFLHSPGICIVDYAKKATEAGIISSMHDPTEGGVASALAEIAYASGKGIIIDRGELQALPECELFCSKLGLDPLGLIASGCLLLTCPEESASPIIAALESESVPVSAIGEVVREPGVRFRDKESFPSFARDELARYFSLKG